MTDKHPLTTFKTPYPGYDVLTKWDTPSFDDVTRRVVAHRLEHVPSRRFLSEEQYASLRAIMDAVLPQDERSEEERIPVEAFIDEKLHTNTTDGTRHVDVLPQREAWLRGLAAIETESQGRYGNEFSVLDAAQRRDVLEHIDSGEAGGEHWEGLVPKSFFRHVLLKQAVKIYYSHPAAWNEIGFGGPAAPRGYLRLGPDMRDPWEAEETRRPQDAEKLP